MSEGRRAKKSSAGTRRNYSDRTLKLLWGRAAGRCAMPACRMEVFADANLPAFLEQFLAQCAKENWPDKDRQCVLDATSLDQASHCGQ